MKRLFIFIFSFIFLFSSLPVYAADSSGSSEDSDIIQDVCFTLFDVIQGVDELTGGDGSIDNPRLYEACESIVEMSGYVVDSGQIAADVINNCIDKTLLSVGSSFIACGQDMIVDSLNLLRQSDDFVRNIWFYPARKLFQWDSNTVKHGVDVVRPLFEDAGIVTLDKWVQCVPNVVYHTSNGIYFDSSYTSMTHYYACWVKHNETQMRLMFANFDANNTRVYASYNPNNTHDIHYKIERARTFPNRTIYYSDSFGASSYLPPFGQSIMGADLGYYDNINDALVALNGGEPSSRPVPNGKGFFRPLPEGEKMEATASNVFNTDFSLYITNNYNYYGDNFVDAPVDDYPYIKLNPDTPSWWYDVYTPDIQIPYDDISDLTNINLSAPDLSVNNSFIVACFSAIPDQLSLLFVSLSVLGAAFFIFKKG